jgi:hypothetical protein
MKVWIQKSVLNGYIIEVIHDKPLERRLFHHFTNMWDAIDFFRS